MDFAIWLPLELWMLPAECWLSGGLYAPVVYVWC